MIKKTESKNPYVEVIILTHNRPDFLQESLESVLAQKYDNFKVIVSDSSSNLETSERYQNTGGRYQYIYWGNKVASEHVRLILQRVRADFYMLFHDDDKLMPNFLQEVMATFAKYPSAMAVGTNAYVMYDSTITSQTVIRATADQIIEYTRGNEFAFNYLWDRSLVRGGAPYPSYVYRKKCIEFAEHKQIRTGDVTTLLNLFTAGTLVNIGKPLMYYRMHSEQDSYAGFSLKEYLAILFKLYKVSDLNCHSPELVSFRYGLWGRWVRQEAREALRKHPRRYLRVFLALLPFFLKNNLRKAFRLFKI